MSDLNLAIIYYSMTGNNYQMAKWAEEAAKESGVNVKVLKVRELAPQSTIDASPAWKAHVEQTQNVPEVSLDDLVWADAIIFSTPTRFGNVASQLKQFIDLTGGLWFQGKLTNKVVSAMSSANNPNGGQEQTILQLYTTMYHWGAIVVSPGFTDASVFEAGGNPYGTSATVGEKGILNADKVQKAVHHQTKRVIGIAGKIV